MTYYCLIRMRQDGSPIAVHDVGTDHAQVLAVKQLWDSAINRPDNPDLGATIQLAEVIPVNQAVTPPAGPDSGFRTPNPPAVVIPPPEAPETAMAQPPPRYQRDLGPPQGPQGPRPSDGSPWPTDPEPGKEE